MFKPERHDRPGIVRGILVAEYRSGPGTINWPGHGRIEFFSGRKVVATAVADMHGHFKILLPLGNYVTRWPRGKSKNACRLFSGHVVVVRTGKVSLVTLLCPGNTNPSR